MKHYRLKRKPLIILTIILTLVSHKALNITIDMINNNFEAQKKVAEKCDQSKGYTCSAYEINLFAKTNR